MKQLLEFVALFSLSKIRNVTKSLMGKGGFLISIFLPDARVL